MRDDPGEAVTNGRLPFWAIVDLDGGRRVGGLIGSHRIAGAGFLRVDRRLYPIGEVACITLTTEEAARAVAASCQPVSLEQVQRAVARYYRVSEGELDGLRRDRRLNRSRQIAMYLAHELTGASFTAVGRAFGARHHTTALRAISNVRRAMAVEPDLRAEVEAVRGWVEEADPNPPGCLSSAPSCGACRRAKCEVRADVLRNVPFDARIAGPLPGC